MSEVGRLRPTGWNGIGDPPNFGALLRYHRVMANMSQADLAEMVGVKECTVMGWESGRVSPGITHIYALCYVFGVEFGALSGASVLHMPRPTPEKPLHLWDKEGRKYTITGITYPQGLEPTEQNQVLGPILRKLLADAKRWERARRHPLTPAEIAVKREYEKRRWRKNKAARQAARAAEAAMLTNPPSPQEESLPDHIVFIPQKD